MFPITPRKTNKALWGLTPSHPRNLHEAHHIHDQCPAPPLRHRPSLRAGSKGQSELHFMYEEAFHRMSKVITSLNVKTATKPRTSDPQYLQMRRRVCTWGDSHSLASSAYNAPTLPICEWSRGLPASAYGTQPMGEKTHHAEASSFTSYLASTDSEAKQVSDLDLKLVRARQALGSL